jgi:hypothetical protein
MAHVAEASYSTSQPSIQLALADRNHRRDVAFFEGVAEGRRRQRIEGEQLVDDLQRCRAERKEALENLGRYRIERNEIREELDFLRSKLAASQAECERLNLRVTELTWNTSQSPRKKLVDSERVGVDAQISAQASAVQAFDATEIEPPTYPVDHPTPPFTSPTIAPVPTSYAEAARLPSRSQAVFLQSGRFQPLQCTDTKSTRQNPTPPDSSFGYNDDHTLPADQPSFNQRARMPKNIPMLQSLMKSAHQPNNVDALRKIKLLCAEAHQTPKEEKTDLQRYLLTHWRNPAIGDLRSLPAPKTNPRLEDPVQSWVEYLTEHQTSWPRGVRRDEQGRPNVSDLTASRLIARLRPEVDQTGGPTSRYGFAACAAQLFSQTGMYQECIKSASIDIAPAITYIRFTGMLAETTFGDLARHFASCGVTLAMAAEQLEPWAREYQAIPNEV